MLPVNQKSFAASRRTIPKAKIQNRQKVKKNITKIKRTNFENRPIP